MTWVGKNFGDRNTPATSLTRLAGMGLVGRDPTDSIGMKLMRIPVGEFLMGGGAEVTQNQFRGRHEHGTVEGRRASVGKQSQLHVIHQL
jgi:hypothetical protein